MIDGMDYRNIFSTITLCTPCLEQSRTWFSDWFRPKNMLMMGPFGILTAKSMLRIPLKKQKNKKNRRERESSFFLSASWDTQGE